MNRYLKEFFHRGLLFGGFGPIVMGVIYAILESTLPEFTLNGVQLLIAIVSVYLLAFLQAGASVFHQIETWSLPKATLCHFAVLFFAYAGCYLLNNWIPFDSKILLIFTGIFVGGYLVIWLVVFISVKMVSKRLNQKLR